MLIEMFLVGTFWFWALLLAAVVAVTILSENDHPLWAFFCVIVTLSLIQFCGNANPFGYLWSHPLLLGILVGLYLPGAVCWSFAKWRMYLEEEDIKYKKKKIKFLRDHNVMNTEKIPDELLKDWDKEIRYEYGSPTRVKPLAIEHKAIIVRWMAYWPFSLLWWMLNDFVRQIFNHIYYRLNHLYQGMADRIFAGVEDDFRKGPESSCSSVCADSLPPK